MLVQHYFIFPFERALFDNPAVGYASLMFIPHGVKVVSMVFNGSKALAPIFVAQMLYEVLQGSDLMMASLGAVVSVLSIYLPLLLYNYLTEEPIFQPPARGSLEGFNLFRVILVYALATALINGLIRASWHASAGIETLALHYVFGDVFGALVALGVLMSSKRLLLSIGRRYTGE